MSVAARAMSIAARAKPSIGGALVLAAIAAVPWVDQHRHLYEPPSVAATGSPELGFETEPTRIVLDPWDGAGARLTFDVIVPPPLRDARPAPEGMVIGMDAQPWPLTARSVDPGILVWEGSPLANMLSVILAPWRALAGLRGT